MLFVFAGPTGAGKDSVINNLVERYIDSYKVPSTVTRARRSGENTGYRYVSHQEFEKLVKQDAFLEYVNVHGNDFYGTLKSDIAGACEAKVPVFKILDVDGYKKVKDAGLDCTGIFIDILDLNELRRRILLRGETKEATEMRLSRVKYERTMAKYFDYIVSDPDLNKLVDKCAAIIDEKLNKRK